MIYHCFVYIWLKICKVSSHCYVKMSVNLLSLIFITKTNSKKKKEKKIIKQLLWRLTAAETVFIKRRRKYLNKRFSRLVYVKFYLLVSGWYSLNWNNHFSKRIYFNLLSCKHWHNGYETQRTNKIPNNKRKSSLETLTQHNRHFV